MNSLTINLYFRSIAYSMAAVSDSAEEGIREIVAVMARNPEDKDREMARLSFETINIMMTQAC